MRIAIPYDDNGYIFQHFGHAKTFMLVDVVDGEITSMGSLNNDGEGHDAIADLLIDNDVDLVLCGGIGAGAIDALLSNGIEVFAGYQGNAIDVLGGIMTGEIEPNNEPNCDHHHDGGCGGHDCGSNGCGGGCHGGCCH